MERHWLPPGSFLGASFRPSYTPRAFTLSRGLDVAGSQLCLRKDSGLEF